MRKTGTMAPSVHFLSCLRSKPYTFLTNLVVLAILLSLWQLRSYETIVVSSPCLRRSVSGPNSAAQQKLSTTNLSSCSVDSSSHASPSLQHPPPLDPYKRNFEPYGSAAALFVKYGAYRGGPNSFAVIGLGSKPTHVFDKPWFQCRWVPNVPNSKSKRTKGKIMKPDWGYGRIYTALVINCTFSDNPNTDNSGGKLFLHAYYSPSPAKYERVFLLEEAPGSYNESRYHPPFQYDYLYCGSPLFGSLNPKRIREWMAYHAHFFGPSSHFVLHDAGGVSPAVRKVLQPWMDLGRVTLQDVRAQAEYNGWYYNQFVILNDCLHRHRHTANWTFMFDVDEYLYLPDGSTLASVLHGFEDYTQFTIEQNPMSGKLCVNDSRRNYTREWGFEKLVFRDDITGIWRDRKYAVQARKAYTAGVHMSEFVNGKTLHDTETRIRYYHFHGSISVMGELCRRLVPISELGNVTWFEKVPFVYDDNLTRVAPAIKQFEEQVMGDTQAYLDYL